jgi:MFS family permease
VVNEVEIPTTSPAPASRIPVIALFTANAISAIGNRMTQLAVPWFVLETTGSAAKTGLVAFFIILPTIFAAFVGGLLIDKLGFRPSSIVSDLICTVTIGAVPLLYSLGLLEFWVLLALVFTSSLVEVPGATARIAILPELAARANLSNEKAGSLEQATGQGASLIGAPLAGLLIAWVGASQVLWLDAASFAISAVLVLLFVPKTRAKPAEKTEEEEPGHWLEGVLDGFKFIWNDRLFRYLIIVALFINMLESAKYSVIMPFYTQTFFGQAFDLGLLVAVSGGGSVAGALIFGAFSERLPKRIFVLLGFVIMSVQYLALAVVPPFWVLLVIFGLTGLAAGPINPIMIAVAFNRAPPSKMGRVFGAIMAGTQLITPFGVLAAGFILEQIDLRLLLLVMGIIFIVLTSTLFLNRYLRELDTIKGAPQTAPGAEN